jgi:hypothetical protein
VKASKCNTLQRISLPEAELVDYLERIGLEACTSQPGLTVFRATSKEKTARRFGVHDVNVFAQAICAERLD